MSECPNTTFHGLTLEYLDAFLFEFDVLCRGYDYTTNPQKLKFFPSTLNGTTLCWFMGLDGGTINNWNKLKNTILNKYQDYFQTRKLKDEVLNMLAKDNETLEEYIEIFQYKLQRSPYTTLSKDILKETMMKGMKEDWVETLNIMGKGNIYEEEYDDIISLCISCSWGST